ncbi:hypothetical protein [Ancylobacter sp. SL191]|uniref:hypothetical protein n=1 Tax=Ancylobacter sp. SL191 TaxID=2995166 RepID=UPI002271801D|nr:hypothetical protein [Ancylobacter sp. SL191]WAC29247.1 hypothetical protein OU996_09570 [Ancylobacter sp. SL191]
MNRRDVVHSGLIAATVLAVPAVCLLTPHGGRLRSDAPDPIFAAIAEHKRLWADVQACDTTRDGEERLGELVTEADWYFECMIGTVPTTLAGMLALVSYVHQANPGLPLGVHDADDGGTWEDLFLATLKASLSSMVTEVRV